MSLSMNVPAEMSSAAPIAPHAVFAAKEKNLALATTVPPPTSGRADVAAPAVCDHVIEYESDKNYVETPRETVEQQAAPQHVSPVVQPAIAEVRTATDVSVAAAVAQETPKKDWSHNPYGGNVLGNTTLPDWAVPTPSAIAPPIPFLAYCGEGEEEPKVFQSPPPASTPRPNDRLPDEFTLTVRNVPNVPAAVEQLEALIREFAGLSDESAPRQFCVVRGKPDRPQLWIHCAGSDLRDRLKRFFNEYTFFFIVDDSKRHVRVLYSRSAHVVATHVLRTFAESKTNPQNKKSMRENGLLYVEDAACTGRQPGTATRRQPQQFGLHPVRTTIPQFVGFSDVFPPSVTPFTRVGGWPTPPPPNPSIRVGHHPHQAAAFQQWWPT